MAHTGNRVGSLWLNIPAEMRALAQWVGFDVQWDEDKGKHTKMPRDVKTGGKASVSNPATWATFEQAVSSGYKHIGFAFTDADPYVVIDLDHKEGADAAKVTAFHAEIVKQAAPEGEGLFGGSYTETSLSGRGVHVIVKGKLASGRRQDEVGLEMYPNGRFVIITGDVWPNRTTIEPCQPLIDYLVMNMPEPAKAADLTSTESEVGDAEIWQRIVDSENGEKFLILWNNDNWEERLPELYSDHSRADMSLLTFLDFHTKDVEQVKRLFKMSKLYRPEKEVGRRRPDEYLMGTLARARAKNDVDNPPMSDPDAVRAVANNIITKAAEAKKAAEETKITDTVEDDLPLPPGFMGALAVELKESVYRPVTEFSIIAALGFMAGVCGRQYNFSNTGLNLYLILVAKSGTGKEGIATSLGQLRAQLRPRIPVIDRFAGPARFPSASGLMRSFDTSRSFLTIMGEFGKMLAFMLDPNNQHQNSVEASILDLYGKSGRWDQYAGVNFAQKENKIEAVQSPAMSVVGETTPSTLYSNLSATNVESGFLPRFCLIEYTGERVPGQKKRRTAYSRQLLDHLENVVNTVLGHELNDVVVDVQAQDDAQALLDDFEVECDDHINRTAVEHLRQLWNRSHLNALRIAALLAVADNPVNPCITLEQAKWGIMVARRTANTLESKFQSGEIGNNFDKREALIVDLVREALTQERTPEVIHKYRKSYLMPQALCENPIGVNMSYLNKRCRSHPALFVSDKMRLQDVVAETVAGLVKDGVLEKATKEDAERLGIKITGRAVFYVPGPNFE